jgi:hypothetical protein
MQTIDISGAESKLKRKKITISMFNHLYACDSHITMVFKISASPEAGLRILK